VSLYTFRRAEAVLQDAEALLAVEQQSLGDSCYTPEEALQVLQRPEQHAYLAHKGAEPCGFCACLETPTGDGPRLEIDMLGVLAGHRGRGIATTLIRMAIDEAGKRGTHLFRGVVAQENVSSQAAFVRAGLAATASTALLLVYEILGREPVTFLPPGWACLSEEISPRPGCARVEAHRLLNERGELSAQAICIQVQTLSYRGFWIEELAAAPQTIGTLLRATIERAKALDLDQVGHLATTQETREDLPNWLRQGYRNQGTYLVFRMG